MNVFVVRNRRAPRSSMLIRLSVQVNAQSGNVVGSKATSRARGSSTVVASCSVIVDDMTKYTHANVKKLL